MQKNLAGELAICSFLKGGIWIYYINSLKIREKSLFYHNIEEIREKSNEDCSLAWL